MMNKEHLTEFEQTIYSESLKIKEQLSQEANVLAVQIVVVFEGDELDSAMVQAGCGNCYTRIGAMSTAIDMIKGVDDA